MKIYDAALEHELQNPDLTRGKLEPARRVTVHHEAVPASVRYAVMADTVTADFPDGLRQEITSPAQEAYDEYEEVQRYVLYTDAELAEMAAKKQAEETEKAKREAAIKKAAEEAQAKAEADAAAKAEQEAKIAKIDAIEAQTTYTAMMTDTLMEEAR